MSEEVVEIAKGFKLTELGPMPLEWEVVRVADVAEFSRKPRSLTVDDETNMPFIPMELISESSPSVNGWEQRKFGEISSGSFVCKGDLIVAKITPSFENGKQALLQELPTDFGYATTEVWALHPKENNRVILWHLFNYLRMPRVRADLTGKMEGSTGRQRLPKHVLADLRIPLPPLDEQRKIAAVLSAVQEAKEKTEAVIEAAKELKKSLMKHLFTYGPVPVEEAENVLLKETEIGELPEDWEIKRLQEVVVKTKNNNPAKTPDWRFKYIDVSSVDRESLRIQDYSVHLGKDAPSRARKQIEAGDVLFATVRPYLKRVAIVPSELDGQICSTAFCVVRADADLVDGRYLFYACSSDSFVQRVSEHQSGSSYPAVTDKDVLSQPAAIPSLPIQRKIVATLAAVEKKVKLEQNRQKVLEQLFKTLLNNLMTAKIRVNDPEVEA